MRLVVIIIRFVGVVVGHVVFLGNLIFAVNTY